VEWREKEGRGRKVEGEEGGGGKGEAEEKKDLVIPTAAV